MKTLAIRGHHLFDLLGPLATGESRHKTLGPVAQSIRANPKIPIQVVVGVDDICSPCEWWDHDEDHCTKDLSDHPDENRDMLMSDENAIRVLGLKPGDVMNADDLYRLIRDKVTKKVFAEEVCVACRLVEKCQESYEERIAAARDALSQLPLTSVPAEGFTSFLDAPVHPDVATLDADVAVLGVPYAVPYAMGQVRSAGAPAYLRDKSLRVRRAMQASRNFDRGSTPADLSRIRIVDCGDVPFDPADVLQGVQRTTRAVRTILDRGAVPVVFGGDDAVPIPAIRAYREHGPIVVVQIDEHLDWAEDINGVREGYSSPMRRVSEMEWVTQTVQIGLHSFSPAHQVEAALAAGNVLVTEREVHEQGVATILDRIPDAVGYFVTIDVDGLDPGICPAVSHPEPGGLTYPEALELLCGLAGKGRIAGIDIVEFVPAHDLNGLGGHTVARLIANLLQAMVDRDQFDARA